MNEKILFLMFAVILLLLSLCAIGIYLAVFYDNNDCVISPLYSLSNFEKLELRENIIDFYNVSKSKEIGKRNATDIFFYLDYSSRYDELILTKVYRFEDKKILFEDIGHYNAKEWIGTN